MHKYLFLAAATVLCVPAVARTAQTAPQAGEVAPGRVPMDESISAVAQQPAGAARVAQLVGREFASYDKDANGSLDRAEFAAWMVALKTAADPATRADAPDTRKWVGAAFAQADKDRSRTLSEADLTGFLSQGRS